MTKIRENTVFAFLTMAVLAIAFLPVILSTVQEKYMMDKLNTTPVDAKEMIDNISLSTKDKLSLFARSKKGDERIVRIDKADFYIDKQELLQVVISELEKMQNLGLLPASVDMDKMKLANFTLETVRDKEQLNHSVSTWYVDLVAPEYSLNMVMDADTNKVYEYALHASEPGISRVDEALFSQQMAQYLKVDWGRVSDYYGSKVYTIKDRDIMYEHWRDERTVSFWIMSKKINGKK